MHIYPDSTPLPPLREDLRLIRGAPLIDGAPSWLIFDAARHRYFQISEAMVDLIGQWREGALGALRARAASASGRAISDSEVAALIGFLSSNSLLQRPLRGGWRALHEAARRSEQGWLTWLIHNYLFVRIPLVRPQSFLAATKGVADLFAHRVALAIVVLLSLLGLYGASRQWDLFAATFVDSLSFEGAAWFALSLAFVKTLHELGHAYMATRFGVRVPTMGVAFMVMMPVLYTDVTDAWRLRSRRQRLLIDSAGILVELSLAGVALFFWAFLPDGAPRSMAFTIATSSLVTSLAINLNPFMRFDGYYILSDLIGAPNLQQRAFDLGLWALREILFGLKLPPPEELPRRLRRGLVLFAWCVWIYRFFLFIGIAALVYYAFFKLLGAFLFAVEILWFIAFPILSELKIWWSMRQDIMRSPRAWISGGLALLALAAFALPWDRRVEIPAIVTAREEARIFAPAAGEIVRSAIEPGKRVRAGDLLLSLRSPELEFEIARSQLRIALIEQKLDRQAADRNDRADRLVNEQQLASEREKLAGFQRQIADLEIRAPIDGVLSDIDPALHPGRWINPKTALALIAGRETLEVKGYARDVDLSRLSVGDRGLFIPDDPQRARMAIIVREIAQAGSEELDLPYLASSFGGHIPVAADSGRKLKMLQSGYRVMMSAQDSTLTQAMPGVVHVEGEARSYLTRVVGHVLRVLVREAGA